MVPVAPRLFSGSLAGAGEAEAGAGCLPVQPSRLVMTVTATAGVQQVASVFPKSLVSA